MEKTKIYKNGVQYEVDPTSLPAATPLAKGAVKQGAGVAKITDIKNVKTALATNAILSSLRNSGVIGNDKFVVLYEPNYTEDLDYDWYYDIYDNIVYTAGQTATVKWEFDDEVPHRSGYNFIGWALTPNAQIPDYPYDENDPQTYTLTFVDNDITLYAVWQLRTCTLTYALGDYGTGSVPAAQTVQEGGDVVVSFSPAPTVNDGSGRVFAGWSTSDKGNRFSDVQYVAGAMFPQTISLYDDVTLYPVFLAQYILTYALGNDATGTVPSAGTFFYGQTVALNFNPSVTCISDPTKNFIGWSETDEDTVATYTSDGTTSIYIKGNVTLYPVFAAAAQSGITIVNTSVKGYTVEVYQGETNVLTIAAGTQEVFNYTPEEQYEISSTMSNGTFDGVYNGTQYSNVSLLYSSGTGGKFYNPTGSSTTWEFQSGDTGTLTIG